MQSQDYEVFYPCLRIHPVNPRSRKIVPYFPGYLFVEADLELVVFPTEPAAYYGPDKGFQAVLSQDGDSWRLVRREALGNALKPEARRGTVVRAYPLEVSVDGQQHAELAFGGGLGHVPLTLTGLTASRGYRLRVDGQRLDQSVHGNDFWQTDYDAGKKQWRLTFNVRPAVNSPTPHTLEFAPDERSDKTKP